MTETQLWIPIIPKRGTKPRSPVLTAFSPIPWWKALMKVDGAKFALGETCLSVAISTEVCVSLCPFGWCSQTQISDSPSLNGLWSSFLPKSNSLHWVHFFSARIWAEQSRGPFSLPSEFLFPRILHFRRSISSSLWDNSFRVKFQDCGRGYYFGSRESKDQVSLKARHKVERNQI